ncbi:MAG: MFS transporter [Propionibacterium sp.]|nr:MFS transporter [Propionibacterium sp.]
MIPTEARRARWGVVLCFFLNGAAWSTLLPRYPEIRRMLEVGDLAWGVMISAGPLGGLIFGLFSARLLRRFGSANVAVVMQTAGILCLNLLGNATHPFTFTLGLVLMFSFDGVCDTAMNSHGLRVQRLYSRSIITGFHAWWSVGAVTGGLLGSLGAQLRTPIWLQCLVLSLVFAVLAMLARHWMLDGKDPFHAHSVGVGGRIPAPVLLRLVALGMMAASTVLIEDSPASWGAIYMDEMFTLAPFWVGGAFVALQLAQVLGRFLGDRQIDRFGRRRTIAAGLVIAAVGMTLAVAVPSPATTILGYALAGWGIASSVPGAMNAADDIPGLPHGTGLTIVTAMFRIGNLLGPPIIGAISQFVGIRWALVAVPLAALVALALTPALGKDPGRRR